MVHNNASVIVPKTRTVNAEILIGNFLIPINKNSKKYRPAHEPEQHKGYNNYLFTIPAFETVLFSKLKKLSSLKWTQEIGSETIICALKNKQTRERKLPE